jgi:hypothetical protein
LKTLKMLYYYLSQSARHLGSSFSLIIWLTVTIKMVTLVIGIYMFIYAVIQQGLMAQLGPNSIVSIILDVVSIVIIFLSVDMPIEKVGIAFGCL